MLIKLQYLVDKYNLSIKGVLHVGAHECEESADYKAVGIPQEKVLWLEALQEKVDKMQGHNIYQMVAHDKTGLTVSFNITNNHQSSSVLPLKEHLTLYPHITVIETRKLITQRIEDFYKNNKIPPNFANFINLDIQGNELRALKGMGDILRNIDYIYTEVSTVQLYDDGCFLTDLDDFLVDFKRVETKITKQGWGDAFYVRI